MPSATNTVPTDFPITKSELDTSYENMRLKFYDYNGTKWICWGEIPYYTKENMAKFFNKAVKVVALPKINFPPEDLADINDYHEFTKEIIDFISHAHSDAESSFLTVLKMQLRQGEFERAKRDVYKDIELLIKIGRYNIRVMGTAAFQKSALIQNEINRVRHDVNAIKNFLGYSTMPHQN